MDPVGGGGGGGGGRCMCQCWLYADVVTGNLNQISFDVSEASDYNACIQFCCLTVQDM